MSLRQLAEADLGTILEDDGTGFGWPITITSPEGASVPLTGVSTDISQVIDPDTGQIVSGRRASVALRIASLTAVGLVLPVGIADAAKKPWLVSFDDVNGNAMTFKIAQSDPDRSLGLVVCTLEVYKT